jgi:DNA-binding CsgD family transcriptional regulator
MHDEREILIKRVFPHLRKLCEERHVTWTEVDLRWGITDEQAEQGAIVPLCLAEIDRCRPFFIGLLGEYYGTPVKVVAPEFRPAEGLPADAVERSVTEIEIVHGALGEQGAVPQAYFYFRDPGFVDRLPPDRSRSDYLSRTPDDARRLGELKERIRQASPRKACVYANAVARALDSDEGPLHLRGATVTARAPSHSQRLGELIRMAPRGAPAGSMSVPRPGDGQLLTILVSSVRGRDVSRFADLSMPDAAVLLFIVDPANRVGIPLVWIMDAYGLTPAEARVALAASSGLTIPETAHRLGLSPNTIKTHLRKVFAKTGTNRQTELARLMTSIGLLKPNGSAYNGI